MRDAAGGDSERRPRDAAGAGGAAHRRVEVTVGWTSVGPPARTCGFSCCPSSSCEAPPMVFQRSFPIVPPTSARSPRAPAPARPAPRTPRREGGTGGGGGGKGGRGGGGGGHGHGRGAGPSLPPRQPRPPRFPPPSDRGQGAEGEVSVAPKLPPKSSSAPPVDITPPPLPIPSSAAPSALDSFRNHSDFAPVSLRIHSRSRCAGIAVGAAAGKAIWGCSGGMSWPFTPSPRPQS